MAWMPTRVEELRVGHYLRIGHAWFDHPFLVNTLNVSSLREIGVIREAGIKRLFIDPERSHASVLSPSARDAGLPPLHDTPAQLRSEIEAEAARLQQVKAQHVEQVGQSRRDALEVAKVYQRCTRDAGLALSMVMAGFPQASVQIDKLLRNLVSPAQGVDNPLALARGTPPVDAQQRHALQAIDAVAIAAMMARKLGFSDDETNDLTQATLLHGVGLLKLPANLRQEAGLTRAAEVQAYRKYPVTGAEMIAACPGLSPAVGEIIAHHRERLDGTGFPSNKVAKDVPLPARIVGIISEYVNMTTRGASVIPTVALASLYRSQREAFGADVIEPFVAALTVYPPGSYVALSDGAIGRVLRVNAAERLRPTVMVFDANLTPEEADIVDLSQVRDLSVTSALDPRAQQANLVEFLGGRAWPGLVLSAPAMAAVAAPLQNATLLSLDEHQKNAAA